MTMEQVMKGKLVTYAAAVAAVGVALAALGACTTIGAGSGDFAAGSSSGEADHVHAAAGTAGASRTNDPYSPFTWDALGATPSIRLTPRSGQHAQAGASTETAAR
jgi:hypothetical protein